MKLRLSNSFTAILGALLATAALSTAATKTTESATTPAVKETEVRKSDSYKTAIFVSNRAGKAHDDKVGSLEDYITSRITDQGFTVISRETLLNAVGKLDPKAGENALDAQLAESSSAVRLAQTLDADYLLQVTLSGFDSKQRTVDAYGVKSVNDDRTVRVSYKILDGSTGASLIADTVKVTKLIQQSGASGEDHSDVLNELLDEASVKVAASLKSKLRHRELSAPAAQELVNVTIQTEAADLMVPDVRINPENTVTISESKFKVTPMSVNVEIDGISVGTAPGTIQAKAGLSKLRITREGFKPWERTVKLSKNLKLVVALEMSEAGYARWKDASGFINELKNGAKLTDAQVKELEGKAKMLQQSGVKVDTKEGIKIENKSIFGN